MRQGAVVREEEAPVALDAVARSHAAGELEKDGAPDHSAFTTIGTVLTCPPKETLFWEGDSAEFLFKVMRGTICLYKLLPDGRRQVARFCHVDDLVGLCGDRTYPYTADALTDATVVRIRRSDLDAQIETDPGLRRSVMESISKELGSAQDQLLLLGRKSAAERVASFLHAMSEQAIRQGGDGRFVVLPMTRVDIADYLGLTHETVCRIFGQLKNRGILKLSDPHEIEILDLDLLSDLACGDGEPRLCA